MAFTWDPITGVNLVLSVIILVLGYIGYKKSENTVSLYVGIAFGLFGLSHLLTLLGLAQSLVIILIAIRTLAYLIVIFAVYKIAAKL